MLDISKLRVGDKVYYQRKPGNKWENGIVKEIPDHSVTDVRVVYNCNGDWKNFKNYTSILTNIHDLYPGWKHEEEVENNT